MRLILGILLGLTLVLAGCGGEDPVAEPAGDKTSAPVETVSTGPVDFAEVAMVSESAVGGEVSPEAVVLDDAEAVTAFAARFDDARMGERLTAEVEEADVPDGETLVGAVVAVACDPPVEVFVEKTEAGLEITAGKIPTDKQCLVPVTTVALVSVDAAAV